MGIRGFSTHHSHRMGPELRSKPPVQLRKVYDNSDLSIRPKTRVSKIDALKDTIKAYRHDPEKVLNKEALEQRATTHLGEDQLHEERLQILRRIPKQAIQEEAIGNSSTN